MRSDLLTSRGFFRVLCGGWPLIAAVGIVAQAHDVPIGVARDRLAEAAARAGISEVQAARTINHLRVG